MKIEGKSLVPDLKSRKKDVLAEGTFWLGALDTLPTSGCHVAGVTFPHIVTVQSDDGMGGSVESSYMGCLRTLKKEQIRRIADALPYLVVRFTSGGEQQIPMTKDLGGEEVAGKPIRRGFVIQIPRKASSDQSYFPVDGDEPLADHIYLVQASARGGTLPKPMSATGIEE